MLKRSLSLITLISFLTTQLAWSAPEPAISFLRSGQETPSFLQVEIPPDLASIEEIYEAPPKPDPRLILHIQNIHGNFEAQSQIKKLLQYLYEKYGFKLVFAEGAVDKLDPEYLQLFPDKERNMALAEALAKRGELTGVEYYLMDGPKDVEAVGIEEAELYRSNYEAFKKVYAAKPEIDNFISAFNQKLEMISSRLMPTETRRLLSEWQKFEAGQRDFLPYVNRLAQDSKRILNLDLESLFAQVEWPQITRLLVIQSMEKDLDRDAAEKEKVRLLQFLKEKHIAPEIITAIEKLGEKKINMNRTADERAKLEDLPRYLFERLVAEAGPRGFYFHDYPAFSLWAGHLILQSELDSKALFGEIERVFDKILDELTVNEDEKNLLELYRDQILLKKLTALELTRKEWDRVVYRNEWVQPGTMVRRLGQIHGKITKTINGSSEARFTNQEFPELEKVPQMMELFATASHFYDFARQRETVFYDTIEKEMTKHKTEKAVLVTGGFHTDGIMEKFREKEVNYGIIMPRIGGSLDNAGYVSSMLENEQTMFDLATLEKAPIMTSGAALAKQGRSQAAEARVIVDEMVQILQRSENRQRIHEVLDTLDQRRYAEDRNVHAELRSETDAALVYHITTPGDSVDATFNQTPEGFGTSFKKTPGTLPPAGAATVRSEGRGALAPAGVAPSRSELRKGSFSQHLGRLQGLESNSPIIGEIARILENRTIPADISPAALSYLARSFSDYVKANPGRYIPFDTNLVSPQFFQSRKLDDETLGSFISPEAVSADLSLMVTKNGVDVRTFYDKGARRIERYDEMDITQKNVPKEFLELLRLLLVLDRNAENYQRNFESQNIMQAALSMSSLLIGMLSFFIGLIASGVMRSDYPAYAGFAASVALVPIGVRLFFTAPSQARNARQAVVDYVRAGRSELRAATPISLSVVKTFVKESIQRSDFFQNLLSPDLFRAWLGAQMQALSGLKGDEYDQALARIAALSGEAGRKQKRGEYENFVAGQTAGLATALQSVTFKPVEITKIKVGQLIIREGAEQTPNQVYLVVAQVTGEALSSGKRWTIAPISNLYTHSFVLEGEKWQALPRASFAADIAAARSELRAGDYYEVLGIEKTDDEAVIKKAFRNKARLYHPDRNPGDKIAEAKFKEVQEAFATLREKSKREIYDRRGAAAPALNPAGTPANAATSLVNALFGQKAPQLTAEEEKARLDARNRIKSLKKGEFIEIGRDRPLSAGTYEEFVEALYRGGVLDLIFDGRINLSFTQYNLPVVVHFAADFPNQNYSDGAAQGTISQFLPLFPRSEGRSVSVVRGAADELYRALDEINPEWDGEALARNDLEDLSDFPKWQALLNPDKPAESYEVFVLNLATVLDGLADEINRAPTADEEKRKAEIENAITLLQVLIRFMEDHKGDKDVIASLGRVRANLQKLIPEQVEEVPLRLDASSNTTAVLSALSEWYQSILQEEGFGATVFAHLDAALRPTLDRIQEEARLPRTFEIVRGLLALRALWVIWSESGKEKKIEIQKQINKVNIELDLVENTASAIHFAEQMESLFNQFSASFRKKERRQEILAGHRFLIPSSGRLTVGDNIKAYGLSPDSQSAVVIEGDTAQIWNLKENTKGPVLKNPNLRDLGHVDFLSEDEILFYTKGKKPVFWKVSENEVKVLDTFLPVKAHIFQHGIASFEVSKVSRYRVEEMTYLDFKTGKVYKSSPRALPLSSAAAYATSSSRGIIRGKKGGVISVWDWELAPGNKINVTQRSVLVDNLTPVSVVSSSLSIPSQRIAIVDSTVNDSALVLVRILGLEGSEIQSWIIAEGAIEHEFSADGKTLITMDGSLHVESDSRNIRVWDAETGNEKGAYGPYRGHIRELKLSSNAKWAVFKEVPNRIHLLDLEKGREEIIEVQGELGEVNFTPDENGLAAEIASNRQKTMRFWDLTQRGISDITKIVPRAEARSEEGVGSKGYVFQAGPKTFGVTKGQAAQMWDSIKKQVAPVKKSSFDRLFEAGWKSGLIRAPSEKTEAFKKFLSQSEIDVDKTVIYALMAPRSAEQRELNISEIYIAFTSEGTPVAFGVYRANGAQLHSLAMHMVAPEKEPAAPAQKKVPKVWGKISDLVKSEAGISKVGGKGQGPQRSVIAQDYAIILNGFTNKGDLSESTWQDVRGESVASNFTKFREGFPDTVYNDLPVESRILLVRAGTTIAALEKALEFLQISKGNAEAWEENPVAQDDFILRRTTITYDPDGSRDDAYGQIANALVSTGVVTAANSPNVVYEISPAPVEETVATQQTLEIEKPPFDVVFVGPVLENKFKMRAEMASYKAMIRQRLAKASISGIENLKTMSNRLAGLRRATIGSGGNPSFRLLFRQIGERTIAVVGFGHKDDLEKRDSELSVYLERQAGLSPEDFESQISVKDSRKALEEDFGIIIRSESRMPAWVKWGVLPVVLGGALVAAIAGIFYAFRGKPEKAAAPPDAPKTIPQVVKPETVMNAVELEQSVRAIPRIPGLDLSTERKFKDGKETLSLIAIFEDEKMVRITLITGMKAKDGVLYVRSLDDETLKPEIYEVTAKGFKDVTGKAPEEVEAYLNQARPGSVRPSVAPQKVPVSYTPSFFAPETKAVEAVKVFVPSANFPSEEELGKGWTAARKILEDRFALEADRVKAEAFIRRLYNIPQGLRIRPSVEAETLTVKVFVGRSNFDIEAPVNDLKKIKWISKRSRDLLSPRELSEALHVFEYVTKAYPEHNAVIGVENGMVVAILEHSKHIRYDRRELNPAAFIVLAKEDGKPLLKFLPVSATLDRAVLTLTLDEHGSKAQLYSEGAILTAPGKTGLKAMTPNRPRFELRAQKSDTEIEFESKLASGEIATPEDFAVAYDRATQELLGAAYANLIRDLGIVTMSLSLGEGKHGAEVDVKEQLRIASAYALPVLGKAAEKPARTIRDYLFGAAASINQSLTTHNVVEAPRDTLTDDFAIQSTLEMAGKVLDPAALGVFKKTVVPRAKKWAGENAKQLGFKLSEILTGYFQQSVPARASYLNDAISNSKIQQAKALRKMNVPKIIADSIKLVIKAEGPRFNVVGAEVFGSSGIDRAATSLTDESDIDLNVITRDGGEGDVEVFVDLLQVELAKRGVLLKVEVFDTRKEGEPAPEWDRRDDQRGEVRMKLTPRSEGRATEAPKDEARQKLAEALKKYPKAQRENILQGIWPEAVLGAYSAAEGKKILALANLNLSAGTTAALRAAGIDVTSFPSSAPAKPEAAPPSPTDWIGQYLGIDLSPRPTAIPPVPPSILQQAANRGASERAQQKAELPGAFAALRDTGVSEDEIVRQLAQRFEAELRSIVRNGTSDVALHRVAILGFANGHFQRPGTTEIAPLARIVRDGGTPEVRIAAIAALGEIWGPLRNTIVLGEGFTTMSLQEYSELITSRYEPLLERTAQSDPDTQVREAAEKALEKIRSESRIATSATQERNLKIKLGQGVAELLQKVEATAPALDASLVVSLMLALGVSEKKEQVEEVASYLKALLDDKQGLAKILEQMQQKYPDAVAKLSAPGAVLVADNQISDPELEVLGGLLALNPKLAIHFVIINDKELSEATQKLVAKIQGGNAINDQKIGNRLQVITVNNNERAPILLGRALQQLPRFLHTALKSAGGSESGKELTVSEIQTDHTVLLIRPGIIAPEHMGRTLWQAEGNDITGPEKNTEGMLATDFAAAPDAAQLTEAQRRAIQNMEQQGQFRVVRSELRSLSLAIDALGSYAKKALAIATAA